MKRLTRLSQRDWRVLDRIFAGFLLVFVVLNALLTPDITGQRWLNALLYAVAAGALFLRRTNALATALVVFPAVLVGEYFLTGPETLLAVAILVLAPPPTRSARTRRSGGRS